VSTLKVNNLQVGQDGTAANNYTLYQPASPDGTVRLGYGVAGSVTDILTLKNSRLGIGAANNTSYDTNAQNVLIASDGNTGMTIRSAGSTPFAMIHFADGTTDNSQKRAGRIIYQHDGDNLTFHTANEERIRMTGDGDVGIGEVSPADRLVVQKTNASGDVGVRIKNDTLTDGDATNPTTASLYLNTSTSDFNTFYIQARRSDNNTHFGYADPRSANHTPNLVITSGGNVGIGTDNPSQQKLTIDVNDSGTSQASYNGINIANTDTTINNGAAIVFGQAIAGNSYARIGVINSDRTGSSEDQDIFFGTIGAGQYAERMRINSDMPSLQVGKNGATNTGTINARDNLIADFGRANINGDIASISVGTGTYRIFSGKVPAIFNQAQSTLTATFRFASEYGVAVIEMDTVGGLAQVAVGRYLMIVDCDTSGGQTAQLSGGSSIQTVLSTGYGNPTFTASGASTTPEFTVQWTRSNAVGSENWANYWHFFAKISNNSPASPCELISLTMS